MQGIFRFDERLGIEVPELDREWEHHSKEERMSILEHWETIRGAIPNRLAHFEERIAQLQELMRTEEDWDATVKLMDQINDFASRIADLNILSRTQPEAELHTDPPAVKSHADDSEEHRSREK